MTDTQITVSFTCTDDDWFRAKDCWRTQRHIHPRWNGWLAAALLDTADITQKNGGGLLHPAPPRIPLARQGMPSPRTAPQHRRSFTCPRPVWTAARNGWWTDQTTYPNLNSYIIAAITRHTAPTPDVLASA